MMVKFLLYHPIIFVDRYCQIVPAALAAIPGAVDADALPLHKHHIDMVKYSSADDLAFQTVLNCIKSMAQVAVSEVHSNWQQEIRMRSLSFMLHACKVD